MTIIEEESPPKPEVMKDRGDGADPTDTTSGPAKKSEPQAKKPVTDDEGLIATICGFLGCAACCGVCVGICEKCGECDFFS